MSGAEDAPSTMRGRKAPSGVSFYDRTKQFMRALPHSLSPPARITAVAMFLHAKDDGDDIFCTVESLMDMTGLTRRTQFRAIKDLMLARFLQEDGWKLYRNGVKVRRRRLDLDRLSSTREAERQSATHGTVLENHSATHGTQDGDHSAKSGGDTVPPMAPKPSLNLPIGTTDNAREPRFQSASLFGDDPPPKTPKPTKVSIAKLDLAPIIAIWNTICGPTLGKVHALTPNRERALRARLTEHWHTDPAGGWTAFCEAVMRSDFLTGRQERGGVYANWRASFDFMVKPDSVVRLQEDEERRRTLRPPTRDPNVFREAAGTI
ncbi:MAG: hypothetical protein ACEQSH_00400 [Bacteroidia bacterium]